MDVLEEIKIALKNDEIYSLALKLNSILNGTFEVSGVSHSWASAISITSTYGLVEFSYFLTLKKRAPCHIYKCLIDWSNRMREP